MRTHGSARAVVVAVLGGALLAGTSPAFAQDAGEDPRVGPAQQAAPPDREGGGNFRIQCGVSHHVADDPIVRPGQPGGSHLHAFAGNTEVDAYSTEESIRTHGGGTCHGGTLNRSGYWIPSLEDADGRLLPLAPWHVYYKNGAVDPTRVEPMPAGLRIVAGNAGARSAQSLGTVRWACGATAISRAEDFSSSIPACEQGDIVIAMVMFPQCWNGFDLDSPDHSSHMAYAEHRGGPWHVCPASHPVPLPQITVNLHQPVEDPRGSAGWRLSSDGPERAEVPGGLTMHADWFDGWDRDIVHTFVTRCINGRLDCSGGTLGDGRALRWLEQGSGQVRVTEPAATHPPVFTDLDGNTHRHSIEGLAGRGVITGYADLTFRPDLGVTRGQAASFLARALDLPAGHGTGFSDVPPDSTHARAVSALVQAGVASGHSDGTFRPGLVVTRGQMAALVDRAFGPFPAAGHGFTDVAGTTHERAVAALTQAGIVAGYGDATFRPGAPVRRDQIASFLARALAATGR